MKNIKSEFENCISTPVWSSVHNSVHNSVRGSVYYSVRISVWRSVSVNLAPIKNGINEEY